jgi:hypothetical protein
MKVLNEIKDVRRRGISAAIFQHIPYLNYLFFIFVIHGAYLSMKNYFLLKKRNPTFKESAILIMRFVLHCTLTSGIIAFLLLFIFTFNPFGEMIGYYWNGLHNIIGGISLGMTQTLFGIGPDQIFTNLTIEERDGYAFITVIFFIFFSILIFTIIGFLLGIITNKMQEGEQSEIR